MLDTSGSGDGMKWDSLVGTESIGRLVSLQSVEQWSGTFTNRIKCTIIQLMNSFKPIPFIFSNSNSFKQIFSYSQFFCYKVLLSDQIALTKNIIRRFFSFF